MFELILLPFLLIGCGGIGAMLSQSICGVGLGCFFGFLLFCYISFAPSELLPTFLLRFRMASCEDVFCIDYRYHDMVKLYNKRTGNKYVCMCVKCLEKRNPKKFKEALLGKLG